MPQKLLRILLKVVLGIFLSILVTGFFIVPLALTLAIPNQGTKYLKHPVHIHSVGFNPFYLELVLEGFEILDDQNQVMLGFDKLMVQVDLGDLFKKIYHVEIFELDGLKVNAELMSGSQINLMSLIPPVPSQPGNKPGPLPIVIIDSIDLHQGHIHFTDKTIQPHFSTDLSAIELHVTHVTTDPKDEAKIKFQANLDGRGLITTETLIKPMAHPLEMETTFSLSDYALGVLTPYAGKYTGRELKDGKLDLRMDYTIGGNKLSASHKILIQRFEFGKSVESRDALHLPFGLVVALLEDPQGKINIALPVSGDMSDPKFKYSHLIFQVIGNFFTKMITSPFSILGSVLGPSDSGTDELGYVRFLPGRMDLADPQKQKLIKLIKTLKERPKLRLEIDGSYDPQADWKAIQSDSFSREYEQLRKTSDWPEGKVYQLLYQRHFGIRALWGLAKKYKKGVGLYNDEKLDQEIKRQLIENAPPDQGALSVLAQARAKQVYDVFLANGFDTRRLNAGHPQSTQSSLGYVPLEFTLTVFDK